MLSRALGSRLWHDIFRVRLDSSGPFFRAFSVCRRRQAGEVTDPSPVARSAEILARPGRNVRSAPSGMTGYRPYRTRAPHRSGRFSWPDAGAHQESRAVDNGRSGRFSLRQGFFGRGDGLRLRSKCRRPRVDAQTALVACCSSLPRTTRPNTAAAEYGSPERTACDSLNGRGVTRSSQLRDAPTAIGVFHEQSPAHCLGVIASIIRIRSERDRAPIFSITLARWASTVD